MPEQAQVPRVGSYTRLCLHALRVCRLVSTKPWTPEQAQDLSKIEQLDPTFPKGQRHDGRTSRRAARRNRFCPKGGGDVSEEASSSASSHSTGSSSEDDSDSEASSEAEPQSFWCEECSRQFGSAQVLASVRVLQEAQRALDDA